MIKIPKFESGGFASLFTLYKPVEWLRSTSKGTTESSLKSSSDDDDTKGKLTEKDLFLLIKDMDGLPNDMNQITASLLSVLNDAQVTGIDGITDLSTTYVKILNKLKNAKFNKEEYKNAYDRAKDNKSLNDVAISETGKVYVLDSKNQLKTITPEQYYNIKSGNSHMKVTPLTNGNLLWLRSNSPKFTNDNTILQIVTNGIGLEKVTELIRNAVTGFKLSQETSIDHLEYRDGSKKKKTELGLQILESLAHDGPEGYYKLLEEKKGPNGDAINAALSYIYTTLPQNAKTRLKIEAGGKESGILNLLLTMLYAQTDNSTKYTVDYKGTEKALLKETGSTSGDDDIEKVKSTVPMQFFQGLGSVEVHQFMVGNELTTTWGIEKPFTGSDNHSLGSNITLNEAVSGNWRLMLDISKATIGGHPLPLSQFNSTLVPSGSAVRIDFPVDEKGNPDLSPKTIAAKKAFDKDIAELGINLNNPAEVKQNLNKIESLLRKHKLPSAYDSNGNIIGKNWKTFAVCTVQTYLHDLNLNEMNATGLRDITDHKEIERFVENLKAAKGDDIGKFDFNGFEGMIPSYFSWDHVAEGTVFIPLKDNIIDATLGTGLNMVLAHQLDTDSKKVDRASNMNYTNPNSLEQ